MDFISGIAEIEADETDEPIPKNRIEAFWAKLVSWLGYSKSLLLRPETDDILEQM